MIISSSVYVHAANEAVDTNTLPELDATFVVLGDRVHHGSKFEEVRGEQIAIYGTPAERSGFLRRLAAALCVEADEIDEALKVAS